MTRRNRRRCYSRSKDSSSEEEEEYRYRRRRERDKRRRREEEEEYQEFKEWKEKKKEERGRGDKSWEIEKERLDEVERIGRQLWGLSPTEQSYAALYFRLKAVRGDLVDGIPPPSWPRVSGTIPFDPVTVQQVPHFSPGFRSSSAIPNAKPLSSQSISVFRQPHPTFTPNTMSRRCYFCGARSHMIRNCRVASRYLKQGKYVRNAATGHITHTDGTPIVVNCGFVLGGLDSQSRREYDHVPKPRDQPRCPAARKNSESTRQMSMRTPAQAAFSTLAKVISNDGYEEVQRSDLFMTPSARTSVRRALSSWRVSSGEG